MTIVDPRRKRGDASDGSAILGSRVVRIDGPLKITGGAAYALDRHIAGLVYAVLVDSTIAAGKVTAIDTAEAERAPDVLLVLTADNALPLSTASDFLGNRPDSGPYHPLARDVTFYGQHVAAVIAETFEQATAAAGLVKVSYAETMPIAGLDDPKAGKAERSIR